MEYVENEMLDYAILVHLRISKRPTANAIIFVEYSSSSITEHFRVSNNENYTRRSLMHDKFTASVGRTVGRWVIF